MNYKNIILSKNNIINLNSIILSELNLKYISHDNKKYIIYLLFNTMNITYDKLKKDKINQFNIEYRN